MKNLFRLLVILIFVGIIFYLYGGNSLRTILEETNLSLEKITDERDSLKRDFEKSQEILNEKISELRDANYDIERLSDEVDNLKKELSKFAIRTEKMSLNESGFMVLDIFRSKKFEELSDTVSESGVIFSMDEKLGDYDAKFSPSDFKARGFNAEIFKWKDESREVSSNFPDFVKNYIFDYDFTSANFIGVNDFVSDKGENFSFDSFTDYEFLEYNLRDEKIDESLVLVFVKESGRYKLRAVLRG